MTTVLSLMLYVGVHLGVAASTSRAAAAITTTTTTAAIPTIMPCIVNEFDQQCRIDTHHQLLILNQMVCVLDMQMWTCFGKGRDYQA